jgi:hypothetical protein
MIATLLCAWLAALPLLVLILLCSVVGGGARVNKAVNRDEGHENRHIEVDGIGDDLLSETQVS